MQLNNCLKILYELTCRVSLEHIGKPEVKSYQQLTPKGPLFKETCTCMKLSKVKL